MTLFATAAMSESTSSRSHSESTDSHSESTDSQRRDRVFAERRDLVDFAFDAEVAAVFPDMIRRSVPGYETVVTLSAMIAAAHLKPGGRCYDLGCSLGAATRAVLDAVADMACEIVAVDDSAAMLENARRAAASDSRVRWVNADVRSLRFQAADVAIVNYTLQFLPPQDRLPLLARIRACLADGGVLLMAEKLASCRQFEDLHLAFKRTNGYSDLEIAQKRAALENVMRIDSEETHLERLRDAGFGDVRLWFRCLNWGSFMARPVAA